MPDFVPCRLPREPGLRNLVAAVRRRISGVLALAALALVAAPPAGAYTLRPGDALSFSIAGISDTARTVRIEPNGMVALPWLGEVSVAGQSVTEVRGNLRRNAVGLFIRRFNEVGSFTLIEIDPADILISVETYRPVTVGGAVVTPGDVPFSPGMTVRRALALAGGSQTRIADLPLLDQLVRLQSDFDAAAQEHALALSRIWRIELELTGESAPPPPMEAVRIPPAQWQEMLEGQWELATLALDAVESERSFNRLAVQHAEARLDSLGRQRENQTEIAVNDDEEEGRIRDLVARSLAPTSRLTEVRRIAILSAAQLLQFDSDIAAVTFDLSNARRRDAEFDVVRSIELRQRQEDFRADADRAERRMDRLGLLLALAGDARGFVAEPQETVLRASVFRTQELGGGVSMVDVALDTPLEPGDLVEFSVELPSD